MKAITPLTPNYTITRSFERLNVRHPVRVWTHVFDPLDPACAPLDPQKAPHCGHAYPIRDRHRIAAHDHEHYEVSVVLAGSARHRTARLDTVIGRGSAVVVAPGKAHALDDIDGLVIVNCSYLTEWLLHDVKDMWSMENLIPMFLAGGLVSASEDPWVPQCRLSATALDACVQEFGDIGAECDQESPSLPFMKWSLAKLMTKLGRHLANEGVGLHSVSFRAEVRDALHQIETVIEENLPFHVGSMANELGMSADYFARIFRAAIGCSPMDYFQRRRVQHACWLLLNTNHSISETAQVLGYCDAAHFTHLFRSRTGMSPRAYRKLFTADRA